jgi:hypothetical protein
MKAELFESVYIVRLDESDVMQWAERWPCYGTRRPLAFEFSASNGDLVDMQGEDSGNDESGILALSNDCALAGALALGLADVTDMRRHYGDAESVADLLANQESSR